MSPYLQMTVNSHPNQYVVKYSDDTAILSVLPRDSSISSHCAGFEKFDKWYIEHHLSINVGKNTRKWFWTLDQLLDHSPISTKGENIKQVSYKYLGFYIINMLNWQTPIKHLLEDSPAPSLLTGYANICNQQKHDDLLQSEHCVGPAF